VQSTDVITASFIIKEAKKKADKLIASTSKIILPSITAQAEAQNPTN
jgi:hypothetical protein